MGIVLGVAAGIVLGVFILHWWEELLALAIALFMLALGIGVIGVVIGFVSYRAGWI